MEENNSEFVPIKELNKKPIEELKKNIQKKEINIGISILRVFLSFMVVMDHLYKKEKLKKYLVFLYYHIPTFFLISFYFTYRTLISFNFSKLKIRIERLLIPYFSWCTISWIIRNIYFYLLKKKCRHSLKDYFINLTNGHIFDIVLWFQNILILTTFLFLLIIFIFKSNHLFALSLIGIIAYLLEYTGTNYKIFFKLTPHYRLTFGRFAEAIPHSFTGFFLASLDIINKIKIKQNKNLIVFYSLIILIMITKFDIFSQLKTFKYGGVRLNIASTCIFFIFSLTNFKFRNKIINKIILQLTNYTAGIYFTHVLIGKGYLARSIVYVKNETLLGCIIIYIISYIISFIGANVFKNTKIKHLFV